MKLSNKEKQRISDLYKQDVDLSEFENNLGKKTCYLANG